MENATEAIPAGATLAQPALLVTAEDVAGLLDISTRTLWRLVSAGKIVPPLKLGGSTRWRRADIEAWVASGCPAPKPRG